jgi:hypothetical protein
MPKNRGFFNPQGFAFLCMLAYYSPFAHLSDPVAKSAALHSSLTEQLSD